MFNPSKEKAKCVKWIRDWFRENGPNCNAVIGISGGKDSSVAAALCVEALGADRVIGVMMPNGVQKDIKDSQRVIEALGIKSATVNIANAYNAIINEIGTISTNEVCEYFEPTAQTVQNLPPRLRMATLYAVSQSCNGRVVNTCNLSETMIGWETRWGDAVGDFSPFADYTASEVIAIGLLCYDLPEDLVVKPPADGLCNKTDEDAFGFTYAELDEYIRTGSIQNAETQAKIQKKIEGSRFKRRAIPMCKSGLPRIDD